MKEIFERTRFLEIQDYPRDYRDCIRQAIQEFNDVARDAVNQFDITYDQFFENCIKCYDSRKRKEVRTLWF